MSQQWREPGADVPTPAPMEPQATAPHEDARTGGPQPRFAPPADDPFKPAGSGQNAPLAGAGSSPDTPAPRPAGMPKGPPSGPPARVGSAVAALIAGVLTLLVPVVFWLLGFYLLALLVNIPAIVLAAVALSKTDDPPEVERFMRYSWAATIIYIGLILVIVSALVLVAMSLT